MGSSIKVVKEFIALQNTEEFRSILGFMNFSAGLTPKFATASE
jgi:hypothetical protein